MFSKYFSTKYLLIRKFIFLKELCFNFGFYFLFILWLYSLCDVNPFDVSLKKTFVISWNCFEIDRNVNIFLNLIVNVFKKNDKQFHVFLFRMKIVYSDVDKNHVQRRQTFFWAKISRSLFNLFNWFNFRNSNNVFFFSKWFSFFHFFFFFFFIFNVWEKWDSLFQNAN